MDAEIFVEVFLKAQNYLSNFELNFWFSLDKLK